MAARSGNPSTAGTRPEGEMMGLTEAKDGYLISILDRLLNDDPDSSAESLEQQGSTEFGSTLRAVKDCVRRDLEWLLNTKRALDGPIQDLGPLETSLWTYGLPDFTNYSLANANDRDRLCGQIAQAIRRFDRRMTNVSVKPGKSNPSDSALHYEIEATLNVEPKPVQVRFDSTLELQSRTFEVKNS
jgi:type VI secretion system protein ImpF